jgi:hypothetical protein
VNDASIGNFDRFKTDLMNENKFNKFNTIDTGDNEFKYNYKENQDFFPQFESRRKPGNKPKPQNTENDFNIISSRRKKLVI